jgi:type IV pilus assembly protein PilB
LQAHGLPADGLKQGEGCESCGQTGYKGRVAIHEMLEIDDTLRTMIVQKRSDNEYRTYAERKGMVSLLADGLSKAAEGVTTIAEVFRVTET